MDTWEAIRGVRAIRQFTDAPLAPENHRCDFLLSFGYPADPSRLTSPNKPGGRTSSPIERGRPG